VFILVIKIYISAQKFIKIRWFTAELLAIKGFSKWRPSAILDLLLRHHIAHCVKFSRRLV